MPIKKLKCKPVAGCTVSTVVAAFGAAIAFEASAQDWPKIPPEMEPLRTAMAIYQDPVKAVHDGYFSTLGCVNYPKGGMGIHFLNPQLLGPDPDPMKPPILLYEPRRDGKLRLVGVEWFVPLATGVKGRPRVYGQDFEGPMEGHVPLLPKELHHYDLHAWLFKSNPLGLFHNSNPKVKCRPGPYTFNEKPPPTVEHKHE